MQNFQFKHIGQSEWMIDLMHKHLPDVGFFVEIGLGHIVTQASLERDLERPELGGSHTAELVQLGWRGIYIEPIEEFCREATHLFKNELNRVRIMNLGASDCYEICTLYGEETLIPNGLLQVKDPLGNFHLYPGRKILCKPTSDILKEARCPSTIDFMVIDVEGYEKKVLNGIDFQLHKPKMLLIETNRVSLSTVKNLLPKNYKFIQGDFLNSCFILE